MTTEEAGEVAAGGGEEVGAPEEGEGVLVPPEEVPGVGAIEADDMENVLRTHSVDCSLSNKLCFETVSD